MSRAIRASRVRLKRAYAPAGPEDGVRVLVDRLWPRGVSKPEARLDRWMKELAPTTELRKWFGHDPRRWNEFRSHYRAELKQHAGDLRELRAIARSCVLTLVYSARDETHNDAVVLRRVILGRPDPEGA